jgi:cell division protein FtsZ
MTINLSMPAPEHELKPRITVIGCGGAGGNAVNNMIRAKLEGVEFVVCNTDAQALTGSLAERRVQLGIGITQGLGAGSRPEIGRAAAEEALADILEHVEGSHMAFIAAGMGGGTGTGAAPVIARACREQGILTVGVVTKPFHFEGTHRMRLADGGIEELAAVVDTLIIIPNQNLFRVANERTTFADAFKMADDVLYSGVRGVTDLMVNPGLINLDFADVRSVMAEMGKAMMGTGEAEGDDRSREAAQKAISNPLLDDVSMKGAKGVLINITGGLDMTLFEVDEAANLIRDQVDPVARIIFGSALDETLNGRIRVSVVATGIDAEAAVEPKPTIVSLINRTPRPQATHVARSSEATARKIEPTLAAAPAPVAAAPQPVVAQAAPAPMAAMPAPMPVAEPMPTPAVAEAAPAPVAVAPQPVMAAPAPAPVARTEPAFIAPRAMEPVLEPRIANPAATRMAPLNAFNAADMANAQAATREAPPRRRLPSLFERVTGTGRARAGETTAAPAPVAAAPAPAAVAAPAPAPVAAPVAAPTPTPAPAAVQQRLGGLDPSDRLMATKAEDDLLDIPAFLRRQAN